MFIQALRTVAPRRAPAAYRALSTTPRLLLEDPNRENSERHAVHKAKNSFEGGLDVQSAGVKSGLHQADVGQSQPGEPMDAAAQDKGGKKANSKDKKDAEADASSANQAAQAGSFVDQVGGQSSRSSAGEIGKTEEAAAPSILASAKSALGLGTSKKEHEDNKTAGKSYNSRAFSTSARAYTTKGDPTDKAVKEDGFKPKTRVDGGVVGHQNEHLKHHKEGEADSGKGNAAPDPSLPSKSRADNAQHSDQESQQKARYHTSARSLAAKPSAGYAQAKIPEPGQAGYSVPGEAYATTEIHSSPLPPNPDLVPSSETTRSSTGQGPAHPTTTKAAKEGKIAERNPPPDARAGQIGLDDAWKERDVPLKK